MHTLINCTQILKMLCSIAYFSTLKIRKIKIELEESIMNLYEAQQYTKKKDEEMYQKIANGNIAEEQNESAMEITKKNSSISPEKEYSGFVTRREFINQTGVFVSASYFEIIYEEFKEAGVPADEFVRDYVDKYATYIESDKNNLIRYEISDDEVNAVGCYDNPDVELSALDLLYNLSELVEHYRDETMELRKRNKQLCNALSAMRK